MTVSWSTDIAAAPRGRRVKVSKVINGKTHTSVSIEREPVWLATKCGRVVLSHWLWPRQDGETMTKARWIMLGMDEQPLAWRPFIEGEFPKVVTKVKGSADLVEYPNGKTPEFPAMILGVAA